MARFIFVCNGCAGWGYLDVFNIAILRVHRAVALVADEGVLAFLDPTSFVVCTVHHIGQALVIDLKVPVGPSRVQDDRGADEGAATACKRGLAPSADAFPAIRVSETVAAAGFTQALIQESRAEA